MPNSSAFRNTFISNTCTSHQIATFSCLWDYLGNESVNANSPAFWDHNVDKIVIIVAMSLEIGIFQQTVISWGWAVVSSDNMRNITQRGGNP